MPRTIKQYYRFVLSKLGMFDRAAFRLAIDEIRADDTFIVSYPKSGNTWVRFLLANLYSTGENIHFKNIDEFVPDIYMAPEKVNKAKSPRFIKVHDCELEDYPKIIYVVRDYRDVLVSYYHYQKSLKEFFGSFSDFVRKVDQTHPFGAWKNHVDKAFEFGKRYPNRILILHYESLLKNSEDQLAKIASFTNYSGKNNLRDVAQRCQFDELRNQEKETGSLFKEKSGDLFFREGKSNAWKGSFSKDDLQIVLNDQHNAETLIKAGYAIE